VSRQRSRLKEGSIPSIFCDTESKPQRRSHSKLFKIQTDHTYAKPVRKCITTLHFIMIVNTIIIKHTF